MPTPDPTSTTITVAGWDDPAADPPGFAPDSGYTEACYLPRLGPTAFVAYRYLSRQLAADPAGAVDIDLGEMARSLGVPGGPGHNTPVLTALTRLAAFGLMARRGDGRYALRLLAPPLTARQAARLPEGARRIHDQALRSRRQGRG